METARRHYQQFRRLVMTMVKQKISQLIDSLLTENAELNRRSHIQEEEISRLRAELFHLKGQKQPAFTPNELDGLPEA